MQSRIEIPKRLYSLDALRGCAALAVVFWHWHNFFDFWPAEVHSFDHRQQPLFCFFKPLYTNGWRAVDLFFCLSGFVFYWLYYRRLSARALTAKEFAVLRFSRLYPLHILTLLFAAATQYLVARRFNLGFLFRNNDLYHFGLQLAFASSWGFERGLSFNGPIWSVSVEVLCYCAFFVVSRYTSSRWWMMALCVGAGYGLEAVETSGVGRGLAAFFIGGLAFRIFQWILLCDISRFLVASLTIGTGALWLLLPLNAHKDYLFKWYKGCGWGGRFGPETAELVGKALQAISSHALELVLFPATLVTLALIESRRGTLGRRLSLLGEISYATYLWHSPLQVCVAGLALAFSLRPSFFYTPASLFLFFGLLILISWLSHRYFERPAQAIIRKLGPG